MKNLLYLFLGFGMILNYSCAADEEAEEETTLSSCADDYAEFYYNDVLFRTAYLAGGGEIVTSSGENCGIGIVHHKAADILTLRIFGEGQGLNIHTEMTNLNEEGDFRFLEYTHPTISTIFDNLIMDGQNYILIEEMDSIANTIKGKFEFKIENGVGDTILVTNGLFNCTYQSF